MNRRAWRFDLFIVTEPVRLEALCRLLTTVRVTVSKLHVAVARTASSWTIADAMTSAPLGRACSSSGAASTLDQRDAASLTRPVAVRPRSRRNTEQPSIRAGFEEREQRVSQAHDGTTTWRLLERPESAFGQACRRGSSAYADAMAKPPTRSYVDDVPDDIVERLRKICGELPDAYEERAWVGERWRVRKKTFAHVLAVDDESMDRSVVLTFRSEGDELEVLRNAGPPFFVLGWSSSVLGMTLDDQTDWDEVRELVTDSFCLMAPKKLAALIDRPAGDIHEPHR